MHLSHLPALLRCVTVVCMILGTSMPWSAACGIERVYSFGASQLDGTRPGKDLLAPGDGALYGVTEGGGAYGYGTVFQLSPDGALATLHAFAGPGEGDGAAPLAAPALGRDGDFYGTTELGGSHGFGTVYRLDRRGHASVLHDFTGSTDDGRAPYGALLLARDGHFYGTTALGGAYERGVLFEISPQGTFAVVHSFGRGSELATPMGALVQATDGRIYGACARGGPQDAGGVFAYAPPTRTTRALFALAGRPDGALPLAGPMQADDGRLYLTTYAGGHALAGTVVRAGLDGTHEVVFEFPESSAWGSHPDSVPLQRCAGRLLLTASLGGEHADGTLLELDLARARARLLHAFGRDDVSVPRGGLLRGTDDALYGTAPHGGAHDAGGVFRWQARRDCGVPG